MKWQGIKSRTIRAVIMLFFLGLLFTGAVINQVAIKKSSITRVMEAQRSYAREEYAVACILDACTSGNRNTQDLVYVSDTLRDEQRSAWEKLELQDQERKKASAKRSAALNRSAFGEPMSVSGVILAESGTDPANFARLTNIYQSLPESFRQAFEKNGWKYVLSSQSLSARFGYSYRIAGLTVFVDKTIYIDDRSSAVNRSVIHEAGHALDCWNQFPSSRPEFAALMSSESLYAPDHDERGQTDARECFANAFQFMIQYQNQYESYSPGIYGYVRAIFPGKLESQGRKENGGKQKVTFRGYKNG